MKKISGIRAQLFFGFGGLVLVISLFYSRLTFLFVDVTQDIVGGYVVSRELTHLSPSHVTNNQAEQFTHQQVVVVDGKFLFSQESLTPSVHDESLYKLSINNAVGYAAKIPNSDDAWLLVNLENTTPLSAFYSVFHVFLFSIFIAVIILSVLSTWFIASKLSHPIRSLTHAVSQQRRDVDCVMYEASRLDEIGQLANAFEETYGELQRSWKREHDFASDVSHELRTPVALIRNTLELNQSTRLKAEERQLIEQSTSTLQSTIEVLLALARKENLIFERIPLLPILERVALAIHHIHPEQVFDVDLHVSADIQVYGNANLISLLCQNLLNNGFYHGDGKNMKVYQRDQSIVFENPLDKHKSSVYQGIGHGQYLVTRMAQVMGWHLTIEYDEDYYRVTLSSFE